MPLIVIRSDLYLDDGVELFLVAIRNDKDLNGNDRKTKWKIQWLMTGQQICEWLGVNEWTLPLSPRRRGSTLGLRRQIRQSPERVPFDVVDSANLKDWRGFKVKTKPDGHGSRLPIIRMTSDQFQAAVMRSWKETAVCPVVVNQGKRTGIEWKKFVNLGGGRSVAISLRLNERTGKWVILKVIDCDAHQLFTAHRLLGDLVQENMRWSHDDLRKRITAELEME